MNSAGEVIAEWHGQRFRAKVDRYGGALIIGGPIDEVQNEGEKAMENEQQPEVTTVVDVGTFVETLLARQTEFETEIRGKLAELDLVVKTALKESMTTIETLIEKRMRRPDPAKSSSN